MQVTIEADNIYYDRPRVTPLKDYPIGVCLKDILAYEDKWDNLWG